MKKIFLIFCIIFLTTSNAFANFEKYYEFESNLDVKFIKSTTSKDKEYKKIEKNEKYIKQGKYYKADKTYSRITVGTGIGLSIVKNILMLHKLNYGVESTVNEGTTFYF